MVLGDFCMRRCGLWVWVWWLVCLLGFGFAALSLVVLLWGCLLGWFAFCAWFLGFVGLYNMLSGSVVFGCGFCCPSGFGLWLGLGLVWVLVMICLILGFWFVRSDLLCGLLCFPVCGVGGGCYFWWVACCSGFGCLILFSGVFWWVWVYFGGFRFCSCLFLLWLLVRLFPDCG